MLLVMMIGHAQNVGILTSLSELSVTCGNAIRLSPDLRLQNLIKVQNKRCQKEVGSVRNVAILTILLGQSATDKIVGLKNRLSQRSPPHQQQMKAISEY